MAVGPLSAILAACGGGEKGGGGGSPTAGSTGPGITAAQIQNASGTVKVLGWEWYKVPESNPPGLTVKWGYLSANEDTITKTQQPGTFDLLTIFQGEIDQLLAVDRIVPIDVTLIPNFTAMNSMFQNTDVIRRDGQVYAVPFQWGYAYVTYDSRQTSAPTSLDDLMSPSLKKKIGVPDDPYAVITTFAKLTGFDNANRLTPDQFQQVLNTMHAFKPQLRTIYTYGEAPQLLGRQDIAIAFPEFGPTVLDATKAGADAHMQLLAAWSYVDCLMIVKSTANLAGDYGWINQAIGEQSEAAVSANGLAFPVVDAAVTALPKSLQYTTPTDILNEAPLQPGPPIDSSQGFVPFQDWLSAWNDYKS